MSLFEDAMAVAVRLPQTERERLAQALGVSPAAPRSSRVLPLQQFVARPDAAAWRKAETGHAVLNTSLSTAAAADVREQGPAAITGMWSSHREELVRRPLESLASFPPLSSLPHKAPVVAHTDVCVELAVGTHEAVEVFSTAAVEFRLATAGYLALLAAAEDPNQITRLRAFVQPFAVLSLGPMASSRAVELMLEHSLKTGLNPLDALIAATALAHEIPLVCVDPRPFASIKELVVCRPYE